MSGNQAGRHHDDDDDDEDYQDLLLEASYSGTSKSFLFFFD